MSPNANTRPKSESNHRSVGGAATGPAIEKILISILGSIRKLTDNIQFQIAAIVYIFL